MFYHQRRVLSYKVQFSKRKQEIRMATLLVKCLLRFFAHYQKGDLFTQSLKLDCPLSITIIAA